MSKTKGPQGHYSLAIDTPGRGEEKLGSFEIVYDAHFSVTTKKPMRFVKKWDCLMKIEDQIEGLRDTLTTEQDADTRVFRTARGRAESDMVLSDLEMLVKGIELTNWD